MGDLFIESKYLSPGDGRTQISIRLPTTALVSRFRRITMYVIQGVCNCSSPFSVYTKMKNFAQLWLAATRFFNFGKKNTLYSKVVGKMTKRNVHYV